jgi:hypothetical protein
MSKFRNSPRLEIMGKLTGQAGSNKKFGNNNTIVELVVSNSNST